MRNTHEQTTSILIFESHTIRQTWCDDEWYFSVIDIIAALTDSAEPRKYWSTMKTRVQKESTFQLSSICRQLKLPASDGKNYGTDCANTENMLHIIQYIPSPKATPFRQWLAQAGAEKLEAIIDPEAELQEWKERAVRSYMSKGYSEDWSRNRVDAIIARKSLTGEWAVRGIQSGEYAILTDQLHMGTFGISVQEHMGFKGYPVIRKGKQLVHKGDLREGMTVMELAVSTFAENLTRGLHVERNSQGFQQVSQDVNDASNLARQNRETIEELTGRPVLSSTNMMIERDGGLWSLLPPPEEE